MIEYSFPAGVQLAVDTLLAAERADEETNLLGPYEPRLTAISAQARYAANYGNLCKIADGSPCPTTLTAMTMVDPSYRTIITEQLFVSAGLLARLMAATGMSASDILDQVLLDLPGSDGGVS